MGVKRRKKNDDAEQISSSSRPYKKTDERVHGVVQRTEAENGPRKSEDAQLRDLQEVGGRMEAPDGNGKAAVHRRSQETEVRSYL